MTVFGAPPPRFLVRTGAGSGLTPKNARIQVVPSAVEGLVLPAQVPTYISVWPIRRRAAHSEPKGILLVPLQSLYSHHRAAPVGVTEDRFWDPFDINEVS